MSYEDCIKEIEQAAGRALTDSEKGDVAEKVQALVNKVKASNPADLQKAVLYALKEHLDAAKLAEAVERRNAMLNKQRRLEMYDYLKTVWKDNPGEGLEAFLGGSNIRREGARDSVSAAQDALFSHYSQSMLADLEKENAAKIVASGKFDDEIYKALWELRSKEPNKSVLKGLQPEAVKAAEIIRKYQDVVRMDANEAGAHIGDLENYITRRSHDQVKIARAAGQLIKHDDPRHFEAYKSDLKNWLLGRDIIRWDLIL